MQATNVILLIGDNPADAKLIEMLIDETIGSFFSIKKANKLADGIEIINKAKIDLVLLDLSLPDSQGLDTLVRLQNHHTEIAIIVLTGNNDEELGVSAIHRGAQDYLIKGEIDSKLLMRSIRYAIERKRHERALREQGLFNNLTKLYTTRYLANRLDIEFKSTRRYETPFSISTFSIKPLKEMKMRFSNQAYEDTLQQIGIIFHEEVRSEVICCHYENEIFLALFPFSDKMAVNNAMLRLRERIQDISVDVKKDEMPFKLELSFSVIEQASTHQVAEQLLGSALKALAEKEKIRQNRR